MPVDLARFNPPRARSIDTELERLSSKANRFANESGDQRWNDLALVLLGARTFTRPLMADADKQGAGDGRV